MRRFKEYWIYVLIGLGGRIIGYFVSDKFF